MAQYTPGRVRRAMVITETTDGMFILVGMDWPRWFQIDAETVHDYFDHRSGIGLGNATYYNVKVRGYPGGCRMVQSDDLAEAIRIMDDEMNREPGRDPGEQKGLPSPRTAIGP